MCQITPENSHTQHLPLGILTILGGDARQMHIATYMVQVGFEVHTMGLGDLLPPSIKSCHHLNHALEGSQVLILPFPATRDQQHINTPLDTSLTLPFEDIAQQLSHMPPMKIFGGRIPAHWKKDMQSMGHEVTDYDDMEDILIKNARFTAEGAIMRAMELTDTSILGSSIAVIGYGRIGQYLSRLLVSWGAKVTVYARREASLAQAASDGCLVCNTANLSNITQGYHVIFNTVPARLISKETLSKISCDTLLMDLASPPFGFDPDMASELTSRCGLGIVFAPALPGRYAPQSAGYVLADSICASLQKGGHRTWREKAVPRNN